MPTIPSLERRTVTPSSRVTNVGVADIGSVGRELGGAIDRTRARVDEAAQKKTRYELADANSKLNILAYQQNSAYDRDDDYETIPTRWDEEWSKGVDQLAAKISDPEARNAFMMQATEQKEANRARITQLAFGKERDVKRSEMNTQYNALRDIVITGDAQQAADAINSMGELAQAGVDNDYYDHEEGGRLTQTWRQDAAIGRIEAIPPSDRVKALEDPLVLANIPADKLAMLRRKADDDVLNEQAMALVDGLGVDFSQMDALKLTRSLADQPELRTKVEQRANAAFVMKEKAEREQMEAYHQDWFAPVVLGERELDPKDPQFLKLDPDLQQSLMRASDAGKAPATSTNPKIYEELIQLEVKKDFKGLRDRVTKAIERNEMSASDIAKYMRIGIEGEVPPEYESSFTIDQRIAASLSTGGRTYDSNTGYAVRERVRSWEAWYTSFYGKPPGDTEIDKAVSKYAMEVELDPNYKSSWIEGSDKKQYANLTYDEQTEVFNDTLKYAKDASDDQFNFVITEIARGLGPRTNDDGSPFAPVAIMIGTANKDKLTDENQAELVGLIKRTESRKAAEIKNKFVEKNGRAPSVNEFLGAWAEEWNAD